MQDQLLIIHYQFSFTPYKRPFRQPLRTRYGVWKIREGIIISLQDREGNVSYGEIAPLPQFGSETLEEALNFCAEIQEITATEIYQIPKQLPACQFAFESALEGFSANLKSDPAKVPPLQSWSFSEEVRGDSLNQAIAPDRFLLSCLLPAGESALTAWRKGWKEGQKTFKWKIGVFPLEQELTWLHRLADQLPASAKLRLDANGGLTLAQAKQWLKIADTLGKIEFLEQPLPPDRFEQMQALETAFHTPIALDESVGTLEQLKSCYQQGWRGIFVVKCAIAGSPRTLKQLCQEYSLDLVFSSAMESAIGREAVFRLAREFSLQRDLGFGINQWF